MGAVSRRPWVEAGFGSMIATGGGRKSFATTSAGDDGTIRIYDPNFRLVAGPAKTPGGSSPARVAFSPDGRKLAVGYADDVKIDILDATTLERRPGPAPAGLESGPGGLSQVAWSRDGRTLYAAGTALERGRAIL